PERAEPVEKLTAGAANQQPLLAFEQEPPDRVLFLAVILPILLDRKIRFEIRPDFGHRPAPNFAPSHARFAPPLKCGCRGGTSIGMSSFRRSLAGSPAQPGPAAGSDRRGLRPPAQNSTFCGSCARPYRAPG